MEEPFHMLAFPCIRVTHQMFSFPLSQEVEYAVSHESQLWSLAFNSEKATQEITVDCTWQEWLNSFVNNERDELNANTINDEKCKVCVDQ